jgi:PAS domain S-box-containing protein
MRRPPLSGPEYACLVEQSPILIWRANTDKLCDYFNDRWLEFTGRTMEQEYGNGWAEGVHPDDFDRCLAVYVASFDRREIFEMEYRLRRHDGAYRWLHDRGVPFEVDGTFAGYIGSCIDVTDRVEAQAALRASLEAELRKLERLLSVCAHCRRVRQGDRWVRMEEYVTTHFDTTVSHGICPSCIDEHFPED